MPTQTERPAGEMTITQLTDGNIRDAQYLLDELNTVQDAGLTGKYKQALERAQNFANHLIEQNREVGEFCQAQSWGPTSLNAFGTLTTGGRVPSQRG